MASMAFRAFVLSVVGQLGDAKIEFESTSLLQPSSRATMWPIKDPKQEVEFMDMTDNEIETKAVKGVDVVLEEESTSSTPSASSTSSASSTPSTSAPAEAEQSSGNQPTSNPETPELSDMLDALQAFQQRLDALQAFQQRDAVPETSESLFQALALQAYRQDLTSKWEDKTDWYSIANSVLIERPVAEVYQAITTSHMWVVCYPDTVGVGGIARRPFKSGDIILEKFLFGSKDYKLIRYQVDNSTNTTYILFHGDGIHGELPPGMTEAEAKDFNSKIGISFEYTLEEVGIQTLWTRRLHFYHAFTDADPDAWRTIFLHMLANNMASQLWGAALYVECVKSFLAPGTEYESELYSTPPMPTPLILQPLMPASCRRACEQDCPLTKFAGDGDDGCLQCTRQSSAIKEACKPKERQFYCLDIV